MIQPWWAVGLAVPGVIVKGLVGGRSKAKKEDARSYRRGAACAAAWLASHALGECVHT